MPILRTVDQAAPVPFRWHRSQLAETDASDHASAACYRLTENVRIFALL